MVVAEVLTGIALVKQATDFIKSNINTVQDIGQIAGQIDDLFRGEQQAQKARNKKAGVDTFGTMSVAQEIIDAKLAQEKLYEIGNLIDLRFGHGTWNSIVTERAKRIQAEKEAALEARRQKARDREELADTLKLVGIVVGLISLLGAAVVAMIVSAAKAIGINT
tara:strand:+ start:1319 stop:1810 length:492 start_codon:yes stop_codon:yes gene_type:complete